MNKLDIDYQNLVKDILENGVEKNTRNGSTLSVFSRQIRHNMNDGFPLLTTKRLSFKTIVTELLWFLSGSTNIKYLVDNNCNIWNGDAYKSYKLRHNFQINQGIDILSQDEFVNKIKTDDNFAKEFGELGPIYGKQWRRWKKVDEVWDENLHPPFKIENIELIDQIQNLINDLKTNPDSRRLIVNAWNVGELDKVVLPPCHYSFQLYTRELNLDDRFKLWENLENKDVLDFPIGQLSDEQYHKILNDLDVPNRSVSLMFNMRSTDVGLGLPFNLASYGLLLMIIAKEVNMVPEELIYSGGDVHLYSNHVNTIKKQLELEPYKLPTVDFIKRDNLEYIITDFSLNNYESHPTIKMILSN